MPTDWLDVPESCGMLDVGESHAVYWRALGHASSIPVVVLHGGPGSGCNPEHLAFFGPHTHRVIMFDQRGSGQSTPSACVTANTTNDLIDDIERLRRNLNIDSWLVFGMSWGACLALLYAQVHPQACRGLILAGLSNRHIHQTAWILDKRAAILPERHQAFLSALALGDQADPVAAYYRKILSADPVQQREATYAVWALEADLEESEPEPLPTMSVDEITVSMVRRATIYLHYWANRTFLPDGHLLINPTALTNLPVTLVHGASDWICPLSGARQVTDAIKTAQLIVVPDAGHSPYNVAMAQTLRAAIAGITK